MSNSGSLKPNEHAWPPLDLEAWKSTYQTLHMWMQMVGKLTTSLTPAINHWWNVAFHLSARGLRTPLMHYGDLHFEMEFDFVDHQLVIQVSDGRVRTLPLTPRSVAKFYKEFHATLHSLNMDLAIWPMPVEVPDPIRFDEDATHASYDQAAVSRLWRILLSVDTVLKEFRVRFIGKCSPVHFFWGSFDLCVTRFSSRRAPERPGADRITQEAYSHEVISAGFWPGSGNITGPAFYAYAAPEPQGFSESRIRPDTAYYDRGLGEYILMYDDVRNRENPRSALLEFLESTYTAGASLGCWDRASLERST